MHDNNIFQPLLEDTLYISARYLAKNDIYRCLIKIKRILEQHKNIDHDLSELFEDSNWRKVYSGCLAMVIASCNQQEINQSIAAAWKNISMAGQDAIPLFGSLQLADKNFNQNLLKFVNNGLPVTLYTPNKNNTCLFIQRQGSMAIIIQHLLKNDAALSEEIAAQLDFEILNKLSHFADPHTESMYDWKEQLTKLLNKIDKQGADAVLASLPVEIDVGDMLDF